MNADDRAKDLEMAKLFKVGDSFLFAVQVPDNSVGCSGSRCSHCGSPVAYCQQICESCSFPFIGPTGFPQLLEWRGLDASSKIRLAENVYTQDISRGRLGYADVEFVPLTATELEKIEQMNERDARSFRLAHSISPSKIGSILLE